LHSLLHLPILLQNKAKLFDRWAQVEFLFLSVSRSFPFLHLFWRSLSLSLCFVSFHMIAFTTLFIVFRACHCHVMLLSFWAFVPILFECSRICRVFQTYCLLLYLLLRPIWRRPISKNVIIFSKILLKTWHYVCHWKFLLFFSF